MPLYEYECQQCHKHTEKRQKFSDPEITACPFCGGKLQRVISAPAFSFAGGGWYKDLYSSNKPAAKESGDSSAKPESKPASSENSATPSPAATPAPASAPTPAAPAGKNSST